MGSRADVAFMLAAVVAIFKWQVEIQAWLNNSAVAWVVFIPMAAISLVAVYWQREKRRAKRDQS
jgi:O-antigen/teichoic acid export membrane protein